MQENVKEKPEKKQKKEKCLANGVTLMEWNYNVEINDDNITHFFNSVK